MAYALNKARLIIDQSIGNEILIDDEQKVTEFNLPLNKLEGPMDAKGESSVW